MDVGDRAAERAAGGQEEEAEDREDEPARPDGLGRVLVVPEDDREDEEDAPVAFATACSVAVRQSGVSREIWSQSRKPVEMVSSEVIAPTMRASHHAWANPCSATPTFERIAATVANV